MRPGCLLLLALSIFTICLLPALAESPVPPGEVAPLEDLVYEVNDRLEALVELLESPDGYDDAKDDVYRGFGVLAVVGQAIAEHADNGETKIQGAALRDAALPVTKTASYEEAQAALAAAKLATEGKAAGDASVEHDWAKLIRMHPMMEEIEEREGDLYRVLRRPRGKPDEPVHASVIAVLTIAMHADTHEVKNPDDIPAWETLCTEYIGQMTGVAKAVRAKDKATASDLMTKGTETCDRCHEQFRD